jgi:hypothetical protein
MNASIVYFENAGKANTAETLRLARRRAEELGIGQVVLASTHGYTALEAAKVFEGTGVQLIAVSISPAFDAEGWTMRAEERAAVQRAGVHVLTGLHGLADGVAEGFQGEHTPGSMIANTLRFLSQGTKVAVEVSIMALEAGLVPPGREIISLGGTNDGCDTALVVRPAFARRIGEFRICELLCKPRMA